MWPYSEAEARWLSAENTEPEEITPEMLNAYLRRAHRLRSEIILYYIRALPKAVGRMIRTGFRSIGGVRRPVGTTTAEIGD